MSQVHQWPNGHLVSWLIGSNLAVAAKLVTQNSQRSLISIFRTLAMAVACDESPGNNQGLFSAFAEEFDFSLELDPFWSELTLITGLGQCFLVADKKTGEYRCFPSEGTADCLWSGKGTCIAKVNSLSVSLYMIIILYTWFCIQVCTWLQMTKSQWQAHMIVNWSKAELLPNFANFQFDLHKDSMESLGRGVQALTSWS